jgi:hypothetical protein
MAGLENSHPITHGIPQRCQIVFFVFTLPAVAEQKKHETKNEMEKDKLLI